MRHHLKQTAIWLNRGQRSRAAIACLQPLRYRNISFCQKVVDDVSRRRIDLPALGQYSNGYFNLALIQTGVFDLGATKNGLFRIHFALL